MMNTGHFSCTHKVNFHQDKLIDKELQFASLTESNAAVLKEVAMFRHLLELHTDRITPSKSKKRRLDDSNVFSPAITNTIETPEASSSQVSSQEFPETPQSAREKNGHVRVDTCTFFFSFFSLFIYHRLF
jgi:hypothetical protein